MQPPVYDTPTKVGQLLVSQEDMSISYLYYHRRAEMSRPAGWCKLPAGFCAAHSNKEPGKTTYSGFPGLFAWWAIRGSNPGPTGYEPAALTN